MITISQLWSVSFISAICINKYDNELIVTWTTRGFELTLKTNLSITLLTIKNNLLYNKKIALYCQEGNSTFIDECSTRHCCCIMLGVESWWQSKYTFIKDGKSKWIILPTEHTVNNPCFTTQEIIQIFKNRNGYQN